MSVNYDNEIKSVKSDEKAALSDLEETYGGMEAAVADYAQTQTKNQKEQTAFAIDKINQQKEWAKQDYIKEQSGAYTDWQKQSNQYGVNAEQRAASGMTNTGYTESSQVSMYNEYQKRVTSARESYVRAVQNYDNAITEARLQNNSVLAEIAYNALQQQFKIIIEKASAKRQIDSEYYKRYADLLAKQEQQRQFNQSLALEREKFAWQKARADFEVISGSSPIKKNSSNSSSGSSKINPNFKEVMDAQDKQKKLSDLTVDQKSVLALGYGPISASKLNSLVESGVVKEYEENGKIKFQKVVKL